MANTGLSTQHRRLLAWVAALGSAGLAAAVTLAGPVTAANDDQQQRDGISYALPGGWTDESKLQPQFAPHKTPMCFYQDGDVGQCNVRIESAKSGGRSLDDEVVGLIGPCVTERARPTITVLGRETRQVAGHDAQYTRWAANCPSGETLGIQAHLVEDLGVVIWSYVDSVFGRQVDNEGVDAILGSLKFA